VTEITMPRLSDSMEEGTILRWLKADGDTIARGDELAEIETDKATMTYEADDAGVLQIAVGEGETRPVGAVIARLSADGAASAAPAAPAVPRGAAPAARSASGPARVRPIRVKASPLARRLAAGLGVDLAGLAGTGPAGRIVKRDVEAAATERPAPEPAVSAPEPPARAPEPPATGARGAATAHQLSRPQATVARRMAQAKATMPDFAISTDVDMDAAVDLRERLKELDGPAPSFNDFVVKACALALRRHPRANAAYVDDRFELYERVNVGVAVAAADALLVPVVADADRRSLGSIAGESRRLAEAARAGTLTPAELEGATFSVSNLGMYGVTHFTAVLNPPQAAILAVGALAQRPVVVDGALAVGHRMTITLTCDHRILYGADAAAFLADVRSALEQPLQLAL